MSKITVLLVAVLLGAVLTCVHAEIVNSDLALAKDSARNISLSEQISQLLDLFNTNRLSEHWPSITDMLSPNCSRDMEQYLQGLAEHAIWAMKSTFGHFLFECPTKLYLCWWIGTHHEYELQWLLNFVSHAYQPPAIYAFVSDDNCYSRQT